MNHDPLDDPMLDGIDQWHATAGTYSLDGTYIPDGTYVRLDDLPALIARVREDEREKHADCRCNELEAMAIVDGKYESVAINGQLLERRDVVLDEAREAVAGTRPQDHPYPECDCPYCCDVALALAAIDALKEGK